MQLDQNVVDASSINRLKNNLQRMDFCRAYTHPR